MKKCKDCLFECTKGSSISLCDVCYDGDEFIKGTKEEYLEIVTKYRKMKKWRMKQWKKNNHMKT